MKFSTDDSDQDIIKTALSWLDRGFRPVVIYPKDYPKPATDKDGKPITIPASGKEPFGARWGLKPISANTIQRDVQQLQRGGLVPGLGLCLGPERAPGGKGLMDIESDDGEDGDSLEAAESRIKLFGGEIIQTIGHTSKRGRHQFFSYDWDRLQPILAKLSGFQKGGQPGVYHKVPELPGLELRIGGLNDKKQLKQLQSVIPPTPKTDGKPRIWDEENILAEVPESFYTFLDQISQEVNGTIPESSNLLDLTEDNEPTDTEPDEHDEQESEEPVANDVPKKKKGRPKGTTVGDSIEEWLRKQFNKTLDEVENAPEGERHATLMAKVKWLAGYLHYNCGYHRDELEQAGIEAANRAAPERAGDNPRCVKEAMRYGSTLPLELPKKLHAKYIRFKEAVGPLLPAVSTNGDGPHEPRQPGDEGPGVGHGAPANHTLTDLGNALRFIDLHGIDVRYVGRWKSWYRWAGDKWVEDDASDIHHRCRDVIPLLRHEAALAGPDAGEKIIKWAHSSQAVNRLEAIEKISRSDPFVVARPPEFDANPWHLNCANGTINLRTGQLQPHIRDDLILKTTGTDYDPAATCPIWEQFLIKIFDGDTHLIDYIQRLVGYSIVGLTTEEIIVFLSGDGANGKTTFFETIALVIGDYSCTCNPDLLIENKYDKSQLHDLSDLFGRRFVFTNDVKENAKLAESMVKHITGGSTIRARRLWENAFEFKPSHTIWFSANHMPDVKGRDHGIWRRIKRIPFDVVIPDALQDKQLKIKLAGERSGILRWIVTGVGKWLSSGLAEPQIVIDAVEEYKEETDLYGPYFEDYCFQGPSEKCRHEDLFKDFSYWLEINQLRQISTFQFGRILKSRKYGKDRDKETRYVVGVRPNGLLKRPGNNWANRQTPYIPPDNCQT